MDNGLKGDRRMVLSGETSNALHITLNGMISVCKELLEFGFKYVLPGIIQSDRIEKEFSIYRQGSGGNYLISVEEILNTLNLERLKLFSKLDIEQKNEQLNNSSCQCDINDFEDEMSDLVEVAFTVASNLSSNERSILYFTSGYVARKENLKSDQRDG